MPHTWIRPFGDDAPTVDPAITAANRIIHMDYPDELTVEERVRAFELDAQLVAGAFIDAVTE